MASREKDKKKREVAVTIKKVLKENAKKHPSYWKSCQARLLKHQQPLIDLYDMSATQSVFPTCPYNAECNVASIVNLSGMAVHCLHLHPIRYINDQQVLLRQYMLTNQNSQK